MAGIFICYRHTDTRGDAGRLYGKLREHFGEDHVFRDVSTLEGGDNWLEVIEQRVGSCKAMVVMIGPEWLEDTPEGKPRIAELDDPLRRELALGLARAGIRVIPTLVGKAGMPKRSDLPDDVAGLADRHEVEISERRYNADVRDLIKVLEKDVESRERREERLAKAKAKADLRRAAVEEKMRFERKDPSPVPAEEPAPPGEEPAPPGEESAPPTEPVSKSGFLNKRRWQIVAWTGIAVAALIIWQLAEAQNRFRDAAEGRSIECLKRIIVGADSGTDLEAAVDAIVELTDVPFFHGSDVYEDSEQVRLFFLELFEASRGRVAGRPRIGDDRSFHKLSVFARECAVLAKGNFDPVGDAEIEVKVDPKEEDEAGTPWLRPPAMGLEDFARAEVRVKVIPSEKHERMLLFISDEDAGPRLRGIKAR